MLNGIGLAIVGQGDRLMIGALLGLPMLGLYAVMVLAGVVPISGILRVLGPLFFAGLHNAEMGSAEYIARLRLFSRLFPIIAGCYALALVALLKAAVPLIFGSRFMISDLAVLLIAMIALFRIIRIEPQTSLLMNMQKTKELAFANLSPVVGLLAATSFVFAYPTIEAALTGILIGEIIGIFLTAFITRRLLKPAVMDYALSSLANTSVVIAADSLIIMLDIGDRILIRVAIVAGFYLLILAGAWTFLFRLYRCAYEMRSTS
jgi:O-antigen/teichoic acid export membrane protein